MTVLVIFYATCCVSHPSQMVTQTKKSRNYGRNELNHEIISISSSPCDWLFWERIHFRFFGVASGKRDNKYTGITLMFELSVVLPARKSQDSCLSWHKTGHYTTLRLLDQFITIMLIRCVQNRELFWPTDGPKRNLQSFPVDVVFKSSLKFHLTRFK